MTTKRTSDLLETDDGSWSMLHTFGWNKGVSGFWAICSDHPPTPDYDVLMVSFANCGSGPVQIIRGKWGL